MEQDFFPGATQETVVVENTATTAQTSESFSHPIAVFFHLAFKITAIVLYLIMTWITESFVLAFIIVVLILAADFWTVKNVTGRLLVGLRWWHYVKEDGTNVWMFESSKNPTNAIEAVIFWTALVGAVPIWLLLAIVALLGLKFQWLFLVGVAVVLSAANIVGYGKCMKDKKKKLKTIATTMAADYVVNNTFT
jgi:hypothetical protein